MGEMLFTDTPRSSPEDDAAQEPDLSTILFQLVEGDTFLLPGTGVEFWEVQGEGKAVFWETEASMLHDAIAGMLEPAQCVVGWWVMENFTASYTKDYEGEVDCDYDHDEVRPAKWSDMLHFGMRVPWWARLLLALRLNGKVPADWKD